jgi:hypothetical protein
MLRSPSTRSACGPTRPPDSATSPGCCDPADASRSLDSHAVPAQLRQTPRLSAVISRACYLKPESSTSEPKCLTSIHRPPGSSDGSLSHALLCNRTDVATRETPNRHQPLPRQLGTANSPLSPEGRRRLVERGRTRPIAHLAADGKSLLPPHRNSVGRYRGYDELGPLIARRLHTDSRQPRRSRSCSTSSRRGRTTNSRHPVSPTSSNRTALRSAATPSPGCSRSSALTDGSSSTERRNQPLAAAHPRRTARPHDPHRPQRSRPPPDGRGWRVHGKAASLADFVRSTSSPL